jgi:metal-responsive CopG/Arc/MetJ family transcriptional regulator
MTYYHAIGGDKMAVSKIAITIDENLLKEVDMLVESKVFPNRSKAIQESVAEKLTQLKKTRLAEECAKLNSDFEQDMADEGLSSELDEWPEY